MTFGVLGSVPSEHALHWAFYRTRSVPSARAVETGEPAAGEKFWAFYRKRSVPSARSVESPPQAKNFGLFTASVACRALGRWRARRGEKFWAFYRMRSVPSLFFSASEVAFASRVNFG